MISSYLIPHRKKQVFPCYIYKFSSQPQYVELSNAGLWSKWRQQDDGTLNRSLWAGFGSGFLLACPFQVGSWGFGFKRRLVVRPLLERRRLREAGFTEQRHLPLSTVEGSRAGAFLAHYDPISRLQSDHHLFTFEMAVLHVRILISVDALGHFIFWGYSFI